MNKPFCQWCGEVVTDADKRAPIVAPAHYECGVRMILGSVGHLQGQCTCFKPDNKKVLVIVTATGDPPGMTRRQAARASVICAIGLGRLLPWP